MLHVCIGGAHVTFLSFTQIGEMLSSGMENARVTSRGKIHANGSIRGGGPAERVLAERLQVYERLSLPASADRVSEIFGSFSISPKVKQKKVALANALWCNFGESDRSAEVMLKLFPELRDSTDLFFTTPSKKALRRFPSPNPIPPPLDQSMWAHRILEDRIRRDVSEVADSALRRVPSLTIRLENRLGSNPLMEAQSRLLKAAMSTRGIANRYATSRIVIQEVLLGKTRADDVSAAPEAKPGATASPAAGHKLDQSLNGTANDTYPGANFWEDDHNGNAADGERFPGEGFWIRQ